MHNFSIALFPVSNYAQFRISSTLNNCAYDRIVLTNFPPDTHWTKPLRHCASSRPTRSGNVTHPIYHRHYHDYTFS